MVTGIDGVAWYKCCMVSPAEITNLELCVCAVYIWVLPEFLPQLLEAGVSRVVALSASSVLTKQDSLDMSERRLFQKIAYAENKFHSVGPGPLNLVGHPKANSYLWLGG